MAATSGSSAASTAHPSGSTTSTGARIALATRSRSSTYCSAMWSPEPRLVTTTTSQRSKARPSRMTLISEVSITMASMKGLTSKRRALAASAQSLAESTRLPTSSPFELACPTVRDCADSMDATSETTEVLPLVPETAISGTRPLSPAGNR